MGWRWRTWMGYWSRGLCPRHPYWSYWWGTNKLNPNEEYRMLEEEKGRLEKELEEVRRRMDELKKELEEK